VQAAMQFAEQTGGRAAIGALNEIEGIVAGKNGTNIEKR
jgi:carbamate kinase